MMVGVWERQGRSYTRFTLNRCHLFCVLLAHGKKRTLLRATALPWGLLFFRLRRKNNKPHQNGECEGTWFPHAPTGDPH